MKPFPFVFILHSPWQICKAAFTHKGLFFLQCSWGRRGGGHWPIHSQWKFYGSLLLPCPFCAFSQKDTEGTRKEQVVGRACKGHHKLHGGSLISQRSGFNCQPIAQKGHASGPLGGDSAVVQSRVDSRFRTKMTKFKVKYLTTTCFTIWPI